MKSLINYYQSYDEDNRLSGFKSRELEFLTTIEAIAPYLKKKSIIADIGAGTGKYSFYFSQKGYKTTAVDIVPKHVEIMRQRKKDSGDQSIEILKGDARKLSSLQDSSFDLVMCLGPFYHLRKADDRFKCLEECKRITRHKGIIAVSYINKYFTVLGSLKCQIDPGKSIETVLDENFKFKPKLDEFADISYFCSPENIEKQIKSSGLKIVDHLGLDGPFNFITNEIERMNEKQLKNFYKYHKLTCRERTILGYSNHGMVLCRKDI